MDSVEERVEEVLPQVNDSLTDIARFIAGIMPEKSKRLKKLASDSTWEAYSVFIDKQWKRFERDRLVHMDTFALDQLKFSGKNHNVFYPFSGPHAACGYLFSASRYRGNDCPGTTGYPFHHT